MLYFVLRFLYTERKREEVFPMDPLKLNAMSVGIIGGADGPTAIFVTGPSGGTLSTVLLIAAALCFAVAIVKIIKKRKK